MPLGWIDFSKSERNKVLSELDKQSEPGTLNELGILWEWNAQYKHISNNY